MKACGCLGAISAFMLLFIFTDECYAGAHGNDCSSASFLALNSSVSASISPAGDQDFFRIEVVTPGVLRVFTTGSTDTYGTLRNSACATIAFDDDRGEGLNFLISGSISPGTYYVSVRHFSASRTGNYNLRVEFEASGDDHGDTCSSATAVSLNSTSNGQINAPGDQDYFRIQVPSSGRIRVFTSGNTDTFGNLRNSGCTSIVSNDDSGAGLNFLIEGTVAAGTYYVSVRHFSPYSTGSYSLRIEFEAAAADDHGNSCASATALSLNTVRGGQIEVPGDQDYFRIQIPAAGRIRVFTTGSTDTFGNLRDSSCLIIAGDDDRGEGRNFLIEGTILAGTYYISVRHYSASSTGAYTLHVEFEQSVSDDHGDSCSSATSVGLNSSIGGQIEAGGDQDYFRIQVPAGGTLTVSTSGTTDTFGNLRDSQCISFAADDDRGAGFNFLIVQAVNPGTYYVSVRHYSSLGTGSYTLNVQFTADSSGDDHGDSCSTATALEANGSLEGRIDAGGDNDFFRIDIPSTGTLTLFTTGNTDTFGSLRNSLCSALTSDDDSGSGLNFYIRRTIAAGTYYVSVRHYSSVGTGHYTLVSQFESGQAGDQGNTCSTATAVGLDSSTNGSIDFDGDFDFFRLEIPSEGTLTATTSGSTDTFGNLYDAACIVLQSDDDSGVDLNFRIRRSVQAGTYFVSVRHFDPSGRGTYVLEVGFTPNGVSPTCLIFVHGTREDDNDRPDGFDWSSDWQAGRDYWRSKYTAVDVLLGGETLLTDPAEDFIRAATGVGQRSHFVVRYDGSAAWFSGEAAGLVAREIIRATNGEMDHPAGSRCALTFAQGGDFWVVAHSGGATVMDFILGNALPDDPNFNYEGAPYDQVAQRINGVFTVGGAHRGSKLADTVCQGVLSTGCPLILQTCTEAREWLQRDEDFQVFNYANAPQSNFLLIGGYRGIILPPLSACLPGEDDGILEYSTQFACQGDPAQGYDTTDVCGNDSKITDGFFNLDGSREDHDNERNNEDINTRNRRAVPDGIWLCNNVPCMPGTLISGLPNLSSAELIDILLDSVESPQAAGSPSRQRISPTFFIELADRYRQRSRYPADSGPLTGPQANRLAARQRVAAKVIAGESEDDPVLTIYPERPQFVVPDPIVFHAHLDLRSRRVAGDGLEMRFTDLQGVTLGMAPLRDDGQGDDKVGGDLVYTASLQPAQALSGICYAEVTADGGTPLGRISFQVHRPDAVLTGQYRERLVEGSLEIAAQVEVKAAGRFHLEASLYDLNGNPLSWAQKAMRLKPGRHWIPLRFYGLAMRERGLPGPYVLRYASLSTTNAMPTSRARLVENAYITQAYSAQEFTAEPYNRRDLLQAAERLAKSADR